jgi:hypothetical protein
VILAEDDYVIVHGRFSNIGLPVNWIAADVVRLKDGILVEHWDVIQDEATEQQSKSGNPMFGTRSRSKHERNITPARRVEAATVSASVPGGEGFRPFPINVHIRTDKRPCDQISCFPLQRAIGRNPAFGLHGSGLMRMFL